MYYVARRVVFVAVLNVFGFDGFLACFTSDNYNLITTTTGIDFYQECECREPGYTVDHLKWVDNNNKIITTGPGTDSNIFLERLRDSLDLHIMNITKSMSGTYKCITEYQGQQYVQTFNVDAYDALRFVDTNETQYLVEGRDMRINCTAEGKATPHIRWHKEREQGDIIEINKDEKYEIVPEGLIVKNVNKNDKGNYKCTAFVLTTGEEVDRFIKIEVMTIPMIKDLITLPEPIVVEGTSLSIECVAEGMPPPQYVWNKLSNADSGEPIKQTLQQSGKTIVFDFIKPEDQGIYECIAFNFVGNVSKSVSIKVLIPPTINNFGNKTGREGETILIDCQASGRPTPNITISMKQDPRYAEDHSMNIPQPAMIKLEYPMDQGVYTCNASNEVGSATKSMYVTVLHKPYFFDENITVWGWNEKVVNLSCVHDSNPPAVVRWSIKINNSTNIVPEPVIQEFIKALTNVPERYLTVTIDKNFAYGIYECVTENIFGQATRTITVKQGFAPTHVTNISLIDKAATSLLFSINGPDEVNGPNVLGYTAEYDESANYNITNIHINRTWAVGRPYRINKLKPNTEYYVRFAAMNEVGIGPWSEMLVFDTLEKSIPETPVWDIDETQLSSGNYVLKWKAPEDNGDPIDYYALRYCPKNDPFDETLCEEEIIEPTSELTFEKLEANTTYYLELIAHNAQGNSTAANITLDIPAIKLEEESKMLPAGAIIGISILIVIVCLILLDLLLLFWRRQGIIASCFCKKKEKKTTDLQARDRKGLLRENCESADNTLRSTNKGIKEYEYNKNTGIITGKHSAV